jgi:transposase
MKMTAESLPNDPNLLKQMLLAARQNLAVIQSRNQQLEAQLASLLRYRFGRSSEKSSTTDQLDLLIEDTETAIASVVCPEITDTEKSATIARSRKPFSEILPREERRLEPESCACPDCGGTMKHIGDDASEMLHVIPEQYVVIKQVRPKYGCSYCDRIAQAPAQERVIDKGMASAALISQVIVDKYADHLPLYRQEERFKRAGIELDRSTLAGWVGRAGALLSPLVEAIRHHVMSAQKIHADDTTAPTLKPGNAKTLTGRYWNYVRDDRPCGEEASPAVWFQYSTTRSGKEPAMHLKGYRGIIQADAYAGYNLAVQSGIQRAGCWAHVRRQFFELAQSTNSPVSQEAVDRINKLYHVEKQIVGRPPDERRQYRQQHAKPLIDDLYHWLDTTLRQCSKGSALGKAINYARKQWPELTLYLENGNVEIDNNAAERAIRPLALGRKNHLFAGSEEGGKYGAALYSIMGTAKLNGIDPLKYLTAVLKRINNTKVTDIENLLPWNINMDESQVQEAI